MTEVQDGFPESIRKTRKELEQELGRYVTGGVRSNFTPMGHPWAPMAEEVLTGEVARGGLYGTIPGRPDPDGEGRTNTKNIY